VAVDRLHPADRKPGGVQAAEDGDEGGCGVAARDQTAGMGAAVETAIGEREQSEVAEPHRAAPAPRDADHLRAKRGRDRLDAGVEAGHDRRGENEGREQEVGAAGSEPATSWSQTRRSTRLSYAPLLVSVGG